MENLVGVVALLFWAFLIGYFIFLFVKTRKCRVPYQERNIAHSSLDDMITDPIYSSWSFNIWHNDSDDWNSAEK